MPGTVEIDSQHQVDTSAAVPGTDRRTEPGGREQPRVAPRGDGRVEISESKPTPRPIVVRPSRLHSWDATSASASRILRRAPVFISLPVRLPGTPIRLNQTSRFFHLGESGCQAPPRGEPLAQGFICRADANIRRAAFFRGPFDSALRASLRVLSVGPMPIFGALLSSGDPSTRPCGPRSGFYLSGRCQYSARCFLQGTLRLGPAGLAQGFICRADANIRRAAFFRGPFDSALRASLRVLSVGPMPDR